MSRFVLGLLSKAGVLAVILQVADTNQVAPFHAEMMMHGRQPGAFARLPDLEPGTRPGRVGGAKTVDVDADARADLAGSPPPVSQENRDRSVGLTRHDPGRKLHGSAHDNAARRCLRSRHRAGGPRPGSTSAALSQDSLVRGLGSSWSQPLLAQRPSPIVGSGRKRISRLSWPPSAGVAGIGDLLDSAARPPWACSRYRRSTRPRGPFARPTRNRPGEFWRRQ